jgi:hypothetical protein
LVRPPRAAPPLGDGFPRNRTFVALAKAANTAPSNSRQMCASNVQPGSMPRLDRGSAHSALRIGSRARPRSARRSAIGALQGVARPDSWQTLPARRPAPTVMLVSSHPPVCAPSVRRQMSSTRRARHAPLAVLGKSQMQQRQAASRAPATVPLARVSANRAVWTRFRVWADCRAQIEAVLRAWTAPIVRQATAGDVYAPLAHTIPLLGVSDATTASLSRSSVRTARSYACRAGLAWTAARGALQFLPLGMCGSIRCI